MKASALCFLLCLGAVALAVWRPEQTAARALRMLAWAVLTGLSCIALLAALFTVWWPPALGWALTWSLAATVILVGGYVADVLRLD